MKCLIIENDIIHSEILPTWIYLLGDHGQHIVHLHNNNKTYKNIHREMKQMGLEFTIINQPKLTEYDLVLHNTVYAKTILQVNKHQKTLLILHNYGKFPNLNQYQSPLSKTIVLGPHVLKKVKTIIPQSYCLYPIYFGPISKSIKSVSRTYLIQGNINFNRRNYHCLIQLARKFAEYNFIFKIIGKDTHYHKLKKIIQKNQVEPKFQFFLKATYETFFQEVQSSQFLLPIIDNSYPHQYFTNQITSSINIAVGNYVPLLLHQDLAKIYPLNKQLTYNDDPGSLEQIFLKSLSISDQEYYQAKQELIWIKDQWMKHNLDTIKNILA